MDDGRKSLPYIRSIVSQVGPRVFHVYSDDIEPTLMLWRRVAALTASGPSQGFLCLARRGWQPVAVLWFRPWGSGLFVPVFVSVYCFVSSRAESKTGRDTKYVQPTFSSFCLLHKVFDKCHSYSPQWKSPDG